MHRRCFAQTRWHLLILWLAALLAPACLAVAQGPPQPPSTVVITSPQLNEDQKKAVEAWVVYWSKYFVDGAAPAEVEQARKQLLRPLESGVTVSNDFRFVYAGFTIRELEKTIGAGQIHTAFNAIIVLSQLGHDKALTVLVGETHKEEQPQWQVRLGAAYGCKTLLESGLVARKAVSAAQDLKRAVEREDNQLVVQRQLAAINSADHPSLQPDERKVVRGTFIDALADLVNKIEKNPGNPHPNPMLEAAGSAIPLLRTKFLEDLQQQPAEQADFGKRVAPLLGKVLAIAASLWDGAQQDAEAKQLLSSLIGTAEGFVITIDTKVRGEGQSPKTRLREAWDSSNKEKFDAELNQWLAILKKAPYSG